VTAGPRRVRRHEIVAAFATGWRLESIEPARLETRLSQGWVPAWFAVVERT
jgi:hypothetical protein